MIKWNEVTWYSKLGAIILFIGIVPILCFYIGEQYEAAVFEGDTPVSNTPGSYNSVPSSSISSGTNAMDFPVPALYANDVWHFASTTVDTGNVILGLSPAPNGNSFEDLSPQGKLYDAPNTDPAAAAWRKMVAADTTGGPIDYYSGDQSFLSYYDSALLKAGYKDEGTINLDKNLNVVTKGTVYFLGGADAVGPHGTVREYEKYYQGTMRVFIVSSSDTKNEVFISDIFNLHDLVLPAQSSATVDQNSVTSRPSIGDPCASGYVGNALCLHP